MSRKEYFAKARQAPYLRQSSQETDSLAGTTSTRANNNKQASSAHQEADAAAGGGATSFTKRVSSFSLLPRVQSTDAIAKQARKNEAQVKEKAKIVGGRPDRLQTQADSIEPDWRLRDRMKTIGVGLVLALNIGTDPPDITKPHPCAVLECWIDPRSVSRSKAKEIIGERLELQYAKWQLVRTARPLKHRRALDPTIEDVRSLCVQLRRQARNERILLHYNGHGVPRPTANGEIWVFDKNHTEYIPLSILEMRTWMGKPSIVVLDCSAAGILVPFFKVPLEQAVTTDHIEGGEPSANDIELLSSRWVNDTIVLCGCSENEWLPMSPDYPADIFTSCLTTPIPIALRWFVRNHPTSMAGLDPDAVDGIPGQANDRKTPLGELNWIFTAVTDSIAWNMLPKPIFQRLFRQDLLVASMFRNFLLADRILRSFGCTPVSHPPLPPGMAEHPLWRAWDLVCETLLFQLIKDGILGNNFVTPPVTNSQGDEDAVVDLSSTSTAAAVLRTAKPSAVLDNGYTVSSPFFSEQLTAFEVWLEFASIHRQQLATGKLEAPEQLPVVLQVLLSQVHRIRALLLLRKFLDLGPWAVNLALSLGIFPYVMKLLQSPEYKSLLVSIWASVLAFDPSCRVDLLKDGALHHFAQHLMYGLDNSKLDISASAKERTMAAFILSICCFDYPAGQAECMRLNLQGTCCALLSSYDQGGKAQDRTVELQLPAHFRFWLVICLANFLKEYAPTQNEAFRGGMHLCLVKRLDDRDPDVRAAACYAVGCLIRSPKQTSRTSSYQDMNYGQQTQSATSFVPASGGFGPSLAIPGPLQAQSRQGAQLQPNFHPQPAAPGIQWRPQPIESLHGQAQQRHPIGNSTQQFLNQSSQFRGPDGQPMQVAYGMQGQPIQSAGFPSPTGFLVGGSHDLGISQPSPFTAPQSYQTPPDQKHVQPSVYEDIQRMNLDLSAFSFMVGATKDASALVRYEAIVSLGYFVEKYHDAFVAVAEDRSVTTLAPAPQKQLVRRDKHDSFPTLSALDGKSLEMFQQIWEAMRSVQRDDPCLKVAQVANQIVSYVHEHLLHLRIRLERQRDNEPDTSLEPTPLANIDEESGTMRTPPPPMPFRDGERPKTTGAKARRPGLRRVLSDGVDDTNILMAQHSLLGTGSSHNVESGPEVLSNALPESEIFAWKKSIFDTNFEYLDDHNESSLDPLSPVGAAKSYRETRMSATHEQGDLLGDHFASLAPKPPKPPHQSIQMLLEQEEEAIEAAEEEATAKRKQLELTESKIFRNEGTPMTAMLCFHSFDDVLVSCGGTGSVAIWDTEGGSKLASFVNGNPDGSRMTTCGWMNENSSSLLYVGCDDGTVRFWGDLYPAYGSDFANPALTSAFHALPMKFGQRGSGLVCDWQQWSGCLLAGGNSATINCWDLGSESLLNKLETNSDANVTTLTTAWDADEAGQFASQGRFGPDTLIAGFSDGALRIFDLRTQRPMQVLENVSSTPNSRRRPVLYKEHKNWVVSTAFTGYANRYELISGTVDGEIKAWDLRMSSSIRTMEVQRSTMTALTVHSKIPIIATGSHAQFIKLLTLDGDTLQVLRHHEKMASHRIGPVSCLAFHKFKPILAAGSTDTFIGLYTTKKPIVI